MLRRISAMAASIRWSDDEILQCLGEYLTEPRANIVFARTKQISAQQFAQSVRARGLKLALPSRMLTAPRMVFINGESVRVKHSARAMLQQFADERRLPPQHRISSALQELLYEWYRAGYIGAGD